MLPSHFSRSRSYVGLEVLSKEERTSFFLKYKALLQQECKDSISILRYEIGMYEGMYDTFRIDMISS